MTDYRLGLLIENVCVDSQKKTEEISKMQSQKLVIRKMNI